MGRGLSSDLAQEFSDLPELVQDELLAHARLLETFGPSLGRPSIDTLKGSRIANLKELRFSAAGGVWRVAFAFGGRRVAVLLVAGDKRGRDQVRFYKPFVAVPQQRFASWQTQGSR